MHKLIFILFSGIVVSCSFHDGQEILLKESDDTLKVIFELDNAILIFGRSDVVQELKNEQTSSAKDPWTDVLSLLDSTTQNLYFFREIPYEKMTEKLLAFRNEIGATEDAIVVCEDSLGNKFQCHRPIHFAATKILRKGRGIVYNKMEDKMETSILINDYHDDYSGGTEFKFLNDTVFLEVIDWIE